ncbi:YqaA family protein [Thermodesulfovibrio sp. 1176]|uniref:YqaA family protein n=1 Tax=unclassified Thermodesulfovibrio TaxID=2645936 RepID=UPI00083ACF73|nr:YqaA family protein [Thermodesulfovibrio sp. 1176]
MRLLKRLYGWVLNWANTPYGTPALFVLAFTEASFFPVPPDVLLISLGLSKPKNAFYYATICTIGSVLGGIFGYFLGLNFWELAKNILFFYIDYDKFIMVKNYFIKYEAWAIGIAGFTPIPYKVFTILAGFFQSNFLIFVFMSVISRGARFFILSSLIYKFGFPIRAFIDKYFNLLTWIFIVVVICVFLLVKYIF